MAFETDEEMKMKRKVLLLSTLGIAAGLGYALESNRRKQAMTKGALPSDPESSANLPASRNTTANSSGLQTERGASMAAIENGKATISQTEDQHSIDDQGTTQTKASHILKEIRDAAFDASNERLALALGRSTEEIDQWTSGNGLIDGDVLMKARALAIQRGLEVE
jgi:hypothetical protein